MGKWEMEKLKDVVEQTITGEWGTECSDGNYCTNVLRTTNFTNQGVIDYENVVKRSIPIGKVENKKLLKDDIILEKSGGSDNQPVGRVVYFDGSQHEDYLCNNFTQILRINRKIAYPRYVFLYLYYLHQNKTTELLQSKTTGIRNLQLKRYMELKVPLPPLDIQQKIAEILDISSAALEKRRAQSDKLDLLVKSQFVEMFGEIGENVPLSYYIKSLSAGKSLAGKEVCKNKVLKTGAATYDFFDPTQVKDLPIDYKPSPEHKIRSGDIIVSRMNTAELVGAAAYIWNAPENTYLPDRLWKAELQDNAHPIFVWQVIVQPLTKNIIKSVAGGTSGSMKNISKTNFLKIPVIKVNMSMQNQFASFVQQVEAQKSLLQTSLAKLELNHKSLMQKCFRGEMF